MKKFVIGLGEVIIDFCAVLGLIVVGVITIGIMVMPAANEYAAMMNMLLALLFGGVALVLWCMSYYFIYLLVNINDNLSKICTKLGVEQKEDDVPIEQSIKIAD